MKRIIYILTVVIALAIILGGVTVSADTTTDNLTRGAVFTASSDSVDQSGASALEGEEASPKAGETPTDVTPNDEAEKNASTPSNNPVSGEESTPSDTPAGSNDENAADDTPAGGNEENGADDTPTGGNEENDANDKPTGGGNEENGADDTPAGSGDGEKKSNPFEVVFATVKEYATEIFCALSFVGSLILAYAYKSGLLPIIKGGIGAISTTVSSIKETAERGESKTDELTRAVCDRLSDAEICLDGIGNAIDELGKRLNGLESDADERKKLNLILATQIDMLYSIFMTSSLPQYQKDEVGAKISEMREALLKNEGE